MAKYTVMTFNLKNDSIFSNKKLKWSTRKDIVISIINKYNPDILGVQELTQQMSEDILLHLPQYELIGEFRNKKSKIANEKNAILFKKDLFTLIKHKTFWLSANPDKPGSRVIATIFPRICTMVQIKSKEHLDVLNIFNTHLDHLLPYARNRECQYLAAEMIAQEKGYHVLMGDLNTTYRSKALRSFSEANPSRLKSIYHSYHENMSTIHTSSGNPTRSKYPIDYIFVSKLIKVDNYTIIKDTIDDLYPSDHFPVICVIETPKQII